MIRPRTDPPILIENNNLSDATKEDNNITDNQYCHFQHGSSPIVSG